MYIPAPFVQTDEARTRALLEAHAFGLLVTTSEEGLPVASHIPMLGREAGGEWILEGHVARPNEQSGHIAAGQRALAVFQGPHAYVSPVWYDNPGVPTWNYAAVHVCGRLREATGAAARAIVERLARHFEGDGPQAWEPRYPDGMLDGIVCFALTGVSMQSKLKMSQNRPAADRRGVIEALEAAGDADARAVGHIMRGNEPRSE